MKKKQLLVLGVASLLTAGILASCGGNQGGSSLEPEVTSSDSRSFNIYFDDEINKANRAGNIEIELGDTYAVWKHISVPKGTYVLKVVSGNISVENHVIHANGYGAWKVTITATNSETSKTVNKSISGNVISPEKAAFNAAWNEASTTNNYTAKEAYSGDTIHNANYNEFEYGTTSSGKVVMQGNVYEATSKHWYSYQYLADAADDLLFQSGYGVSHQVLGTVGGFHETIPSYAFVEQFKDGESTGTAYIADSIDSTYGSSELLEPLMTNFIGELSNNWISYTKDYGAVGAIVTFGENEFEITPAKNATTPIPTWTTSSKKTYATTVTVTDIGLTSHEAVEDWLAAPDLPEAIDSDPVVQAFANIETARNYTMTSSVAWIDASTNREVEAPNATWAEYMAPFTAITNVADDVLVNVVLDSDPGQFNFYGRIMDDSWTIPAAGSVTAEWVNGEGYLAAAAGTLDSQSGKITYGNPQTGTKQINSLWGHAFTQTAEGESWALPLVAEGIKEIIPGVSFTDKNTEYNYYYFNTCGDDMIDSDTQYGRRIISWTSGAVYGGLFGFINTLGIDNLACNVGLINAVNFGAVGAEYYFNYVIEVAANSVTLTCFSSAFASGVYFWFETSFTNIGTTVIDDDTMALVNGTSPETSVNE